MKNKRALIFIVLLVIMLGIALLLTNINWKGSISIYTDKKDYAPEASLKVGIKNESNRKVCFSSCTPYEIEVKKGKNWVSITDSSCGSESKLAQYCINSGDKRAFALLLPPSIGTYRIKVPGCFECSDGQEFKAGEILEYSNEFNIKK